MGIAAYNRGSAAIGAQIEAEKRPAEFEMMGILNGLEKYPDAGRPFGTVHFWYDQRGCWVVECPKTGFGFWPYKTLHEAVRRWRVNIVGFDNGRWIAEPRRI